MFEPGSDPNKSRDINKIDRFFDDLSKVETKVLKGQKAQNDALRHHLSHPSGGTASSGGIIVLVVLVIGAVLWLAPGEHRLTIVGYIAGFLIALVTFVLFVRLIVAAIGAFLSSRVGKTLIMGMLVLGMVWLWVDSQVP